MQNQEFRRFNPRKSQQKGNALWFILIAIALLTALTLAVTRSSNRTMDNLGAEEARIVAGQIARTISSTRDAVQQLMTVNGCSEQEISFDNSTFSGLFANPNSPVDKRCHVYDPAGAGLTVVPLPAGAQLPDPGYAPYRSGWLFSGANAINGVGPESDTETICTANCADLIMFELVFTAEICQAYNDLQKITGIPADNDGITTTFFKGVYDTADDDNAQIEVGSGDSTTALYGVTTACIKLPDSFDMYMIYAVLIAR